MDVKNQEVIQRFGRIQKKLIVWKNEFLFFLRNCGEMAYSDDGSAQNYENGPICASGSAIIYAWALDADKTELPKG